MFSLIRKKAAFLLFPAILSLTALSAQSQNPLALVKTDDPRDTMRTFMSAMNDYRRGVESGDERLKQRIHDALRTFPDIQMADLLGNNQEELAAILLKEVIDRIIVINYDLIPDLSSPELSNSGYRWRLRDSEITIRRIESGERQGEYLFTSDTVQRSAIWYDKVKHLPYRSEIPENERGAGFEPSLLYDLSQLVPHWAQKSFLTIAWWQWFGMTAALLIGLLLKITINRFLLMLYSVGKNEEGRWMSRLISGLARPAGYMVAILFWSLVATTLRFEGALFKFISMSLKVAFSIVAIWLIYRCTGVLTEYLRLMSKKTESTLDDQLVPLLNRSLKIFVLIATILFAIQNLGINVFSLLAGLGIGGLAFALAARDTVANFFGSLMILFDRPFQVGDWVVLGELEGTIEEIGFRSTRIKTFYDSQVTIPNSDMAVARIDNMGRRNYRRIKTNLGVTYDTPPDKLEAFIAGIKTIIENHPASRKDYFHVVFSGYGASSLDLLLYFFVKVKDWSEELQARQEIYLSILRLAEEQKVSFAFPTRTLHLDSLPDNFPNDQKAK